MPEEKQGICETCGFLGTRPARRYAVHRPPGFYEVELDERASPRMAFWLSGINVKGAPIELELACYRAAANLIREIEMAMPAHGLDREKAARQVLAKPRACQRWGEYQPGLDPSGHLAEMKYLEIDALREKNKKDSDRAMRRLTWRAACLAVGAALLVGFMQMTSESVVYRAFNRLIYGEAKISTTVVQPSSPLNE